MKRKLISIIALTLVMAMTLTACGTKGPEATNTKVEDKTVTINIMSTLVTEQEGTFEKEMADKYMKDHTNVKINLIGVPVNEISKKIIALNTSGDLPDAFFLPSEFMATADKMGLIEDNKELVGKEFLDSLQPGIAEGGTINGHMVLVPWHVIPVGLIYRSDWAQEAGIDKIETWADFQKAAKAFTKDINNDGKVDRWGFSMVGTRNGSGESRFMSMARTFGVNEGYKDNSGKWVSDLTSDNFKRALTLFTDFALKDGVVPPGATETGYPEASAFFAQEKTGLMITGANAIGAIENANPKLKGKLKSVPIPKDTKNITNLQVSGYAITKSSKNKEIVADYLKSMSNKDFSIPFGQQFGRLPVTKEALSNEAFKTPTFQGFIDSAQYAAPPSAFGGTTELFDIAGEAYNTMISKKISIDDAMKVVTERTNKILNDNNK